MLRDLERTCGYNFDGIERSKEQRSIVTVYLSSSCGIAKSYAAYWDILRTHGQRLSLFYSVAQGQVPCHRSFS